MVFGAVNVVGGYVVTDRMLQMFRKKPTAAKAAPDGAASATDQSMSRPMSHDWVYTFVFLAWLAGAACFVLGLHQMNSPATARQRQPAQRGRHGRRRRGHPRLARRPAGRPERHRLGDHRSSGSRSAAAPACTSPAA